MAKRKTKATEHRGRFLLQGRTPPKGRRGIAAVELAVVLPFVMFLFVVAVDYCRIFYFTQTLQNCAYVGAAYASGTARVSAGTGAADAATRAAVAEGTTLAPPLRPENVSVAFNGSTTTVTIQYEYQTITPLLGDANAVVLTRTVTMPMAPVPGQTNSP